MDSVQLATVLAAVVLVASLISVEVGLTVALLELALGVAAGNLFHLHTQGWLDFIAQFGSIVLTFLAGMEVDPAYMRRRLGASLGIGVVSFLGPFLVASATAYLVLDWSTRAPLIAGRALSTTSLFFVKGGMNVSLGAVATNLGLLAVLLVAKMLPKIAFIYPLARRADRRHGSLTTLLMSTGLTFGTISSLYGLNAGIIDKNQFSLLVSVVVLSAVVPTAVAERWFLPDAEREQRVDRRLAYAESEEYV
ncbi:MAG: hypothetical protein V7645_305 [Actinomycetota bacterium]